MTTTEIQTRKAIEIAWATHLDNCMDPECATCSDFERQIAAATVPNIPTGRWVR